MVKIVEIVEEKNPNKQFKSFNIIYQAYNSEGAPTLRITYLDTYRKHECGDLYICISPFWDTLIFILNIHVQFYEMIIPSENILPLGLSGILLSVCLPAIWRK